MLLPAPSQMTRRVIMLSILIGLTGTTVHPHEAWLLTPAEIVALAAEPMPYIFTSYVVLGLASLVGCGIVTAALLLEERLEPLEARIAPKFQSAAFSIGPTVLRVALATMLALAGTGGLPRHGTDPWVEPTLLVPDMQLSLLVDWGWLAPVQIGLALFLVIGLYTRLVALALIGLVAVGLGIFDAKFVAYAPHFAAPALALILTGAGPWSLDRIVDPNGLAAPPQALRQGIWRLSQILVGAGFIYLAVVYKLTQPTLLIAILQHGNLPTFGLPLAVIALVMTGVEIICGALLVAGRLIRPVSLTIMGAITFLAITLGETPLFHANLYGVMFLFALAGAEWPATPAKNRPAREVTA